MKIKKLGALLVSAALCVGMRKIRIWHLSLPLFFTWCKRWQGYK